MLQNEKREAAKHAGKQTAKKAHPIAWDLPILFAIMFSLAIALMVFTTDILQYKQKNKKWSSSTERNRIAFLLFSFIQTIMLSAVYIGFHFAQKFFNNMHHTIFVVLSTIFWIVSGVLIHSLLAGMECGAQTTSAPPSERTDGLKLPECVELKIIMILSWCLAAISIISCIAVVWRAMHERKQKMKTKKTEHDNQSVHSQA